MSTMQELIQDIADRQKAMADQIADVPNEEKIRALIAAELPNLATDEAFVRKMRFGTSDPDLRGTKFARYGYTIADIEFLYELQETLKGQRRVSGGTYQGPSAELTRAFTDLSEATYLSEDEVKRIDRQALDDLYPRIPKSMLSRGMTRDRWVDAQARAMDTAESGYGSQLIGAQYVADLWEVARQDSRVFGLIDTFEMTAPTAYLPVEVDFPELLWVSESTANNSSNYTTVKTGSQRVQVDAKKFVMHQMWSGEMEEDSIIPFVPFLRTQAAKSLAFYSDSLVINGDTTNAGTGNINLDDADPADTKHYLAFDGIRHAALVDNSGNAADVAGAITLNVLRDQRGLMLDDTRKVDWGHPNDSNDLVYVADVQTADRIALLDEVIAAKQMQGASANLLNGQVASILGHPVISSMAVSKTEADGKVSTTANQNVKGQVVTFNRRGYKVGWRRRVKVETERLPATDQTRIVYSLRMGFGRFTPTGAASGIESAAVAYDISL